MSDQPPWDPWQQYPPQQPYGLPHPQEEDGNDFALSVNDLAMSKGSSTWADDDGGTRYLQINSECTWKVKIVDEP